MNTSSPAISLAALLAGQSGGSGSEAVSAEAGDFTSALAAAAAPQLFAAEEDLLEEPLPEAPPEGMPSAAALAFLSGLLPGLVQSEAVSSPEGSTGLAAAEPATDGLDVRQAAVLALLGGRNGPQGKAAQVVPADDPSTLQAQPAEAQAASEAAADVESLFSLLSGSRTAEPAARSAGDSAGLSSLLSTGVSLSAGSRAAASEPAMHAAVKHGVGTPGWADEVGSRLVMMSLRGQHEGSLTLSPEHLGPLEVRISVSQDRADVWFGAQHAETRAALADALPRLRELFASSGMSLGEAGVSHDMPRQETRASTVDRADGPATSAEAPAGAPVAPAPQLRSLALLDTWA